MLDQLGQFRGSVVLDPGEDGGGSGGQAGGDGDSVLEARVRVVLAGVESLKDEQGYDATTVEQIAAAAGVSHMTFFRYFPAKEDAALSDSYDPLLAGLLQQTPAAWPLIDRIRAALLHGLRQLHDTDRDTLLAQNKLIVSTPALRERLWASQMDSQQRKRNATRDRIRASALRLFREPGGGPGTQCGRHTA